MRVVAIPFMHILFRRWLKERKTITTVSDLSNWSKIAFRREKKEEINDDTREEKKNHNQNVMTVYLVLFCIKNLNYYPFKAG